MTKAKKTSAKNEKRFRVIAVPYQKDFRKFGLEVEKHMNDLLEAGYNVSTDLHKQGIAVMAQKHSEERVNPIQGLMQALAGRTPAEFPHLSRETQALLGKIIGHMPDASNVDTYKEQVAKVAGAVFKEYESEALRQIVPELESELKAHTERCDAPNCGTPRLLTEVVEQIKRYVALQLQ